MLVAILKGEDNLNEWLKNPRDSGPTVSWHNIHGKGRIDYGVDKDDDYYFALGNLHDQSVQMHLQIHFDAKLYNTETADFRCSFLSDTCRKEVSLVGSSFALLITPARVLDGVDVWHVKVTYGARWATYISTVGLVGAISAAFFIRRKKNSKRRQDTEDDPLIGTTTTDSHGDYKSSGTSSTEGTEPSAPVQPSSYSGTTSSNTQILGKGEIPEEQLCAICLDSKKDSFFDPCGHCATCYNCGLRIMEDETSSCPICRQKVEKVRRLYNA
ncbi:hypothetical protein O6H91_02G141700 [Diphasiastrum complanatum]|uniref:Uncharacterized protein n=1 Tax=Diphasiastrum complanatum TaxID=34168 RepID=A0ACC2ELP3_DIPCM|nr:hypothetical protein O6H91_02G141700 [Diphasiastrum complanatum]